MDTWSSLLLLTFVRLNPKLERNCNSGQGQRIGYALITFSIGSTVFQLGGLLYRLCYSIKFIITLNEGLRLQLLAKTLKFLTGFAYKLLKI